MKRVEDFGKVIKVVTELMDVSEQDILGKSRVQDVVDARWMVIYLMKEQRYSSRQISILINHPERTVNHAASQMEDRVKYSINGLGNILAIARKQLSNNAK